MIQCGPGNINGVCGVGLYGGKPSPGVCRRCEHFKGETVPAAAMPAASPARSINPADWPTVARWVAGLRKLGEIGLGDTVARVLSVIGAKTLAEAYAQITGSDCRCADRQAKLNQMYPYPKT